jgi:signal transduction histidine kinase
MDPATENILAMSGKPFQAFKGQDHQAHITTHLNFMATNIARNSPPVMAALEKNIFEHISLMAQEQLEVEFRDEIQQLMQMQQMLQQNPALQQNPQYQQQIITMTMNLEARKAKLIAEMTEEFKNEENKIMGEFGNDPIAKLKARELDLRAMDDESKRDLGQEKLDLDKSKQLMGQDQFDEKLAQNEELAQLRADTSLQKQAMSQDAKLLNDMIKQEDVKILKGPRR